VVTLVAVAAGVFAGADAPWGVTGISTAAHWESVYGAKQDSELSWFQDEPEASLALIGEAAPEVAQIVDVGGGQSSLAPALTAQGHHVTVLDVSANALDRARRRAGAAAPQISWIVGDVTRVEELGSFDVWHDRAVFHFLHEAAAQARYAALLRASLRPAGVAVIATFALDGPARCSGLPVQRYDAAGIVAGLGGDWTIAHEEHRVHTTPWAAEQAFQYVVLRRG